MNIEMVQIEQQLKIYIDNLKYKLECTEKEQLIKDKEHQEALNNLVKDKRRLEELLSLKDKEIKELQKSVEECLTKVKKYESQQDAIKREVMKQAEDKYKQHIVRLTDELEQIKQAFSKNFDQPVNDMHKKNQLSLTSSKSTSKIIMPTSSSTHQSVQGVKESAKKPMN